MPLTGLSYDNVVIASGLAIVGMMNLINKEKLDFGTFMNAPLIGAFVDVTV